MLQIKNIVKTYVVGDLKHTALKGVSINFRKNEFVSILGQSGSGKTTLLNIIGGLDHYDSGDVIINGISTKKYKDSDWDAYRNHSIGFIFQSYNLIPHQTVLSNVELALTLAGISKKERKERAIAVLKKVGLEDQIYKKPNQMSGGQMQRVAIARALVNNPEILLADEPTGALDSETSVQIMELLKEIAKDKLVIMVTHNPRLAEQYSTRIVQLLDGNIIGDSHPFEGSLEKIETKAKKKKVNMSFLTALSLSFNNLLTKKARTILTSFAGSIGIIGISLILSLSTGFQAYINQIQEDTLTSYPLTISTETGNAANILLSMRSEDNDTQEDIVNEKQYIQSMFSTVGTNDIQSFNTYLEENKETLDDSISLIQYKYDVSPNIYIENESGISQVFPNNSLSSLMGGGASSMMSTTSVFNEMLDDEETLTSQYDVLAGRWPQKYDEMILVLSDPNEITDLMIYGLGLRDSQELKDMIAKINANEKVEVSESKKYTYDDLLSISYKLIDPSDTYQYNEKYDIYEDMTNDEEYMKKVFDKGIDLKIVGIVCAKDDAVSTSLSTGVAYKKELTEYVIQKAEQSEIVQKQLKNPEIDVFSHKRFDEDNDQAELDFQDMISIDTDMLSSAFGISVSESDISNMTKGYMETISQAITADTSQAEEAFLNNLSTLTKGLLEDYLKNHIDSLTNAAILESSEVENIVSDYLTKEESQKIFKNLEETYTIPSATFQSTYQKILTTFLQGYIQIAPINSDDSRSIITEELIEPMVNQLLSQNVVKDTATQLATKMVEAGMQKTILGTVGELSQDLINTMAHSFHIDESKISSAFSFDLNEEELMRLMETMTSSDEEKNADKNLRLLGYQNLDEPESISFYFKDFESKEKFLDFLDDYNQKMEKEDEDKVINYTDLTGILTSSVKLIVDSVSYVLIAFVSISLVVSSIMIGIITYISVLERTKEIGILRAMGASKRNISSIFNAETFIVGLCAGLIGIGITLMLIPPINYVIHNVTGNQAINATLPLNGAIILIALSIILTLISGLIPSKQASQKDPVTALRTE